MECPSRQARQRRRAARRWAICRRRRNGRRCASRPRSACQRPGTADSVPPASMLFGPQAGFKRPRARPGLRVGRLAVVVRVEDHRARGAGRGEFGEDDRPALRNLEEPHAEASPLKHRLEPIGVPADVGLVRRDVGNRQQVDKFLDDRLLVRHTGTRAPPRRHRRGLAGPAPPRGLLSPRARRPRSAYGASRGARYPSAGDDRNETGDRDSESTASRPRRGTSRAPRGALPADRDYFFFADPEGSAAFVSASARSAITRPAARRGTTSCAPLMGLSMPPTAVESVIGHGKSSTSVIRLPARLLIPRLTARSIPSPSSSQILRVETRRLTVSVRVALLP